MTLRLFSLSCCSPDLTHVSTSLSTCIPPHLAKVSASQWNGCFMSGTTTALPATASATGSSRPQGEWPAPRFILTGLLVAPHVPDQAPESGASDQESEPWDLLRSGGMTQAGGQGQGWRLMKSSLSPVHKGQVWIIKCTTVSHLEASQSALCAPRHSVTGWGGWGQLLSPEDISPRVSGEGGELQAPGTNNQSSWGAGTPAW